MDEGRPFSSIAQGVKMLCSVCASVRLSVHDIIQKNNENEF